MRTVHIALLLLAMLLASAVVVDARQPSPATDDADVWEGGPPRPEGGPPGPDGPEMMRRGRMMSHRMSEEQEAAALEFLGRLDPEIEAWFRQMKLTSPMRYNRMIHFVAFRLAMMENESARDSTILNRQRQIMRLQIRVESLSNQYRRSQDQEARASIERELRTVLDELFDLREEEKRADLERMSRELERLRSIISERRTNKAEIVDRRLQQLIGERETMEW